MDTPSDSPKILVVDDEPSHRDSLKRIFDRAGYDTFIAEDGNAALTILRNQLVDIILSDLVMPRMDGQELLRAVQAMQPETDVILMTAYGTVENAVNAMREGAYDFITKPVKRNEVLACVSRAVQKQALVVENRSLRAQLAQSRGPDGLIGNSGAMAELRSTVHKVAASSATVLLEGESGTGKEICARAIHQLSPRANQPFVAVNCAALPDSILEAELFGAEKGAYTGSVEQRKGRFERAHSGTLFLDEVGDIPMPMQVKLLRALQEGEIERLGGSTPISVDVRLVAATNRSLKKQVEDGLFREDLYYRLDVISLQLPPLKDREGDVPLLAAYFLKRFSDKHQKRVLALEKAALDALQMWSWPGNVRELENVIERGVVLASESTLQLDDLPQPIQNAASVIAPSRSGPTIQFRVGSTMEQLERAAIQATLRHTGGDKQLTAKLLGTSVRTIYRRLEDDDEGIENQTKEAQNEDE